MDNLTHTLVGLAAAKAGLERLSPGATPLCLLAANAPDIDIVILLFGDRWTFLEHHRGITHAIVGTVCLTLLLPLLFYTVDLLISRYRQQPVSVRFKGLLIASAIASITHPLLDWTNNYGIRFLLPWNPHWYYGDFVFIVDPYLWLILGSVCFLLSSRTRFLKLVWIALAAVLTFMVVVGPRAADLSHPILIKGLWIAVLLTAIVLFTIKAGERWGARIAQVGIALALVYWSCLFIAHRSAAEQASQQAAQIAARNGESVSRLATMPTLANPFDWDCVFETERATYRFPLLLGQNQTSGNIIRYEKPDAEVKDITQSVASDRRTRIFLGFARFPVVRLSDPDCATQTLVQFADLRYTEPGKSRGTFALELPVDCNSQQLIGSR